MSFPKYEKYKDSGVEWLGEVPEHWDVKRLRYLANARKGKLPSETFPNPTCSTDLPYLSMEFLRGESDSIRYVSFVPNLLCAETGDIMLLWDGSNAGEFLRAKRGVVSSTLALIEPKNIQKDFLAFACKFYERQLKDQTVGMGIPHVSGEELRSFAIPYPDQNEQVGIASFLDRETAKIDELVAEQQRLIELLKEKRQAVISHAVTRGLNPNVKLKSSGIEWLGDIPAHWEIGSVKRFFSSKNNRRIPLSNEERSIKSGDFPYYGASGIIDYIDEFIFEEDLILVSEDGANLINRSTPIAFIASGRYWVNNHAHILKTRDSNLVFWSERLESIDLTPFITGSAQPKLTSEALNNLMIAIPPTEIERAEIQKYIIVETSKLDVLMLEAKHAIKLLQERRTALISAAVTGKIDVRQLNKN